ncbi:hypothetical protein J4Q44_G00072630 [Coregonus suidteri]|uniref:Uncharacterized protein n=1 Tax=Coregonus suidteri TaxID=861788 RepID=A0AAN8N7Z5_9TELE
MGKKDIKTTKAITPLDVVQNSNPLVNGIAKLSEKWNKRWPDIEQPWPVEGTLNPDVIKIMQVLVSTYKADQKKGKKGKLRKEKRQRELGVLKLFENEGQKLIKDTKDTEKMAKEVKVTEKLMAEVNTPFSYMDSAKTPPPYEKEAKFKDVYPQLPVIIQEGDYCIRDEDEQIIERGQAETTIKINPNSKSRKKTRCLETKGRARFRRMELYDDDDDDDDDQSDSEEIMGGYDPVIRQRLARAERRGDGSWKKKNTSDSSPDENEDGDNDEDLEIKGASYSRGFDPTMTSTEEIERDIDRCVSCLDKVTSLEEVKKLEEQLQKLKIKKKKLLRKESQESENKYTLRPRKEGTSKTIMPVIIRGHNLEYKPLQNTDMSDILEKLPTLQDGAYPWISKLEEITVGTQSAIGDIKRLLANLLGIPGMEEIFQRAGLHRYVGTAVNDPELLAASRNRLWRALRDTFPTNVHPDNILIDPLGQQENPRAYVSRVHQVWRNITGNDPDVSQIEQSILRAKLQMGLPLPIRSKLAEVVGLGSMTKGVYTDHIAHQVDLYRKKEHNQKAQDQETLRKLNQIQLVGKKKEKKSFGYEESV